MKNKTHSGAKKRVRLAGSKKRLRIKVRAVNRAHILTKESAKKKLARRRIKEVNAHNRDAILKMVGEK